jgi:hypothetical protein
LVIVIRIGADALNPRDDARSTREAEWIAEQSRENL